MKANTKKSSKVQAAEDLKNTSVLGTYEGECADSTITNLNGLDITREVWENVFNSDEYKKAIENRWYIGYLGHPSGNDPDCQDFRKACIVMTEGHIAENGKVYGKFDLVNTPVGQIVKAFQDAGVIFGISVRGAGDIVNNSVDPDTFVFRGFDLVTFPAFPESIPTFTAIAASTDADKRKKYQAVCAAVADNIDSLDTIEAVNTVQSCFAKQSSEYKMLEAQKQKIQASEEIAVVLPENPEQLLDNVMPVDEIVENPVEKNVEEVAVDNVLETDPRVESMTKLYLDLKEKYDTLSQEHLALQNLHDQLLKDDTRKLASVERICSSQINDLHKTLETIEASLKVKTREVNSLRRRIDAKDSRLSKIQSSMSNNEQYAKDLEHKLSKVQASLKSVTESNESLRKDCRNLVSEIGSLKEENLKYNKMVRAAKADVESKETIISNLKIELDETVRKHDQGSASNRDAEIAQLKSRITSAESHLKTYQDAYANLYANAIGVQLPKLRVTASTDVDNLQRMIRASVSIPVKPDFLEPTQDVDLSDFEMADYDEDSTDLVTL